eukprot:RCo048750
MTAPIPCDYSLTKGFRPERPQWLPPVPQCISMLGEVTNPLLQPAILQLQLLQLLPEGLLLDVQGALEVIYLRDPLPPLCGERAGLGSLGVGENLHLLLQSLNAVVLLLQQQVLHVASVLRHLQVMLQELVQLQVHGLLRGKGVLGLLKGLSLAFLRILSPGVVLFRSGVGRWARHFPHPEVLQSSGQGLESSLKLRDAVLLCLDAAVLLPPHVQVLRNLGLQKTAVGLQCADGGVVTLTLHGADHLVLLGQAPLLKLQLFCQLPSLFLVELAGVLLAEKVFLKLLFAVKLLGQGLDKLCFFPLDVTVNALFSSQLLNQGFQLGNAILFSFEVL